MKIANLLDSIRKDKMDVFRKVDGLDGPFVKQSEMQMVFGARCRLSVKKTVANAQGDQYAKVDTVMSVFSRPEVNLKKGDRIHLTTTAGEKYILYAGKPRVVAGSHLEVAVQEDEYV